MKRIFASFVIFLILTSGSAGQTENLTILYLNDTHSCLAPLGPRNQDLSGTQGGIARAASLIGSYETSPGNTLTLHSGDFSVGDLFYNKFFGVPELQILNQIGVDAVTLGNHEFDLGPLTLENVLNAAFGIPSTGFPLLSANADLTAYPGNLNAFIKPYSVKTFGAIKVGIFGLTTHEANILSNPSPVVIDDDFLNIAGGIVQTLLTTEDCDFIICLSHYGMLGDQALATYIPGINLIIGGHDHIPVPPAQIGNTWIVQGYPFYSAIGKIEFEISSSSIIMKGHEIINLDNQIPEYPPVAAVVSGLIADIETTYGPVYSGQIGNSNSFMEEYSNGITKPGNHSTSAGNFITDAMRWKTGTDFAIQPNGSIAQSIYQGPIVPADLFRAVGYGFNTQNGLGFRLVTASISGFELYKGLEIILTFLEENEDYFLQFSGLELKYMPDAREGERIASVKINKKLLSPVETYTFTSNELVIIMLDAFGIIYNDVVIMDSFTEFQNLCEYALFLEGKIKANSQARIIGIGNNDVTGKKESASSGGSIQNYPNPFNPSTIIKFHLPEDGIVKLIIYNSIGEKVEVLTDGFRTAGEYEVVWNAGNYPAGIYLSALQSSGYSHTQKMILVK